MNHKLYDTWYDVIRPKIWPIPCSMIQHFITSFYMGIFLFPRHCIFHVAILKSLSPPWGSMYVIHVSQNYRAGPYEHLTRNAKCNCMKIDRTQQNMSNSINVFILQNYISWLKLSQCVLLKNYLLLWKWDITVFELLWKKFRIVIK